MCWYYTWSSRHITVGWRHCFRVQMEKFFLLVVRFIYFWIYTVGSVPEYHLYINSCNRLTCKKCTEWYISYRVHTALHRRLYFTSLHVSNDEDVISNVIDWIMKSASHTSGLNLRYWITRRCAYFIASQTTHAIKIPQTCVINLTKNDLVDLTEESSRFAFDHVTAL